MEWKASDSVLKKDTAPAAAAAAAEDVMGDVGIVTCSRHPSRHNLVGVCPFCLHDKLRNLVSSSSPSPSPFPASHCSSSPPSYVGVRPSNIPGRTPSSAFGCNPVAADGKSSAVSTRARISLLLLARRKKKKKKKVPSCPPRQPEVVLKRCKSSGANPIRRDSGGGGFWSFLRRARSFPGTYSSAGEKPEAEKRATFCGDCASIVVNGAGVNHFPGVLERKVSRSRSVGCGNRSFSGDFFDNISTGLGDCTLRRVESHREGHRSNKTPKQAGQAPPPALSPNQLPHKMNKCGGIFGSFMMILTPSSASSYQCRPPSRSGSREITAHCERQHCPGQELELGIR